MKIVISPAKSLNFERMSLQLHILKRVFLKETTAIQKVVKKQSPKKN